MSTLNKHSNGYFLLKKEETIRKQEEARRKAREEREREIESRRSLREDCE